ALSYDNPFYDFPEDLPEDFGNNDAPLMLDKCDDGVFDDDDYDDDDDCHFSNEVDDSDVHAGDESMLDQETTTLDRDEWMASDQEELDDCERSRSPVRLRSEQISTDDLHPDDCATSQSNSERHAQLCGMTGGLDQVLKESFTLGEKRGPSGTPPLAQPQQSSTKIRRSTSRPHKIPQALNGNKPKAHNPQYLAHLALCIFCNTRNSVPLVPEQSTRQSSDVIASRHLCSGIHLHCLLALTNRAQAPQMRLFRRTLRHSLWKSGFNKYVSSICDARPPTRVDYTLSEIRRRRRLQQATCHASHLPYINPRKACHASHSIIYQANGKSCTQPLHSARYLRQSNVKTHRQTQQPFILGHFFKSISNAKNEDGTICGQSGGGTTRDTHIRNYHAAQHDAIIEFRRYQGISQKISTTFKETREEIIRKNIIEPLPQEIAEFHARLVDLIAIRGASFGDEFKDMCHTLNPRVGLPTGDKKMSSLVSDMQARLKKWISRFVRYGAITLDSRDQRKFLGVTFHFLSPNFTAVSVVIGMERIEGPQTSLKITETLSKDCGSIPIHSSFERASHGVGQADQIQFVSIPSRLFCC
ncbi:MAG: LOW QUALITY PROTEIN: hypothetical protein J3Q66DRAFT_349704, partial [Benniella sp.]